MSFAQKQTQTRGRGVCSRAFGVRSRCIFWFLTDEAKIVTNRAGHVAAQMIPQIAIQLLNHDSYELLVLQEWSVVRAR